MSVERKDPSLIAGVAGTDLAAYIESDFKIRSGLCPNGHGLMNETNWGQECSACGFSCNIPAEKGDPQ